MASLYELKDKYLELYDAATSDAETEGGELSPVWVELLGGLEKDIESKLDGCVRVYKSLTAHAEVISAEAKRLAERAKAASEHAERLKAYMKENLEAMEVERFAAGPFELAIQKNGQPAVRVLDIALVPECYDKVRDREIDKKLVLESYQIGMDVPGCIVERGTHLRIR